MTGSAKPVYYFLHHHNFDQMIHIEQLELLIESIKSSVPSSGVWPFTVLALRKNDLKGCSGFDELSDHLLLFVIRNDFTKEDMLDYITNSNEIIRLPEAIKPFVLEQIMQRQLSSVMLPFWKEKQTTIVVGMAMFLAREFYFKLNSIPADMREIDLILDFQRRGLRSFFLLNVLPSESAFLK